MPKVLIAMPCMDTIPVQTVGSLLGLDKPSGSQIVFVANSLVYDARDQLCQIAINNNMDYLLFIDSDMIFPKDSLDKLIARDKDIVSGVYYARKGNHEPVVYKGIKKSPFRKPQIERFTKDELSKDFFEIGACGMGLCLIKIDVIKKIWSKKQEPFRPLKHIGEDLSFCVRAKKSGFKIYADSTIELGHIGQTTFRQSDWVKV